MDSLSLVLIFTLLASSQCFDVPAGVEKISNNIIRNNSYYYLVYPKIDNSISGTLSLDESTDLTNWPQTYPIFDTSTYPAWSDNSMYRDPDINVINPGMVRLYFVSRSLTTNLMSIGVAFADQIKISPRMYDTLGRALITDPAHNVHSPSLVFYDAKSLLLVYVADGNIGRTARLTDNGLDIISASVDIFVADKDWEGGKIVNQWGFQKNGYIYIFYQTGVEGNLGVVRSKNPLGPYEKIQEPLKFSSRTFVSRQNLQKHLSWNENDWPYLAA